MKHWKRESTHISIFDTVFANWEFWKDPKLVKAEDSFSGINVPGNMSNQLGSNVTPVDVEHEILVLLEVTLYVGFVTSDPDNCLIAEVLYPGDVSVFPVGLIHFRFNIGKQTQLPSLVSAARIQV
ncbi:hypothetical protein V6N13_014996 [Hibiscus sabdariffa]